MSRTVQHRWIDTHNVDELNMSNSGLHCVYAMYIVVRWDKYALLTQTDVSSICSLSIETPWSWVIIYPHKSIWPICMLQCTDAFNLLVIHSLFISLFITPSDHWMIDLSMIQFMSKNVLQISKLFHIVTSAIMIITSVSFNYKRQLWLKFSNNMEPDRNCNSIFIS